MTNLTEKKPQKKWFKEGDKEPVMMLMVMMKKLKEKIDLISQAGVLRWTSRSICLVDPFKCHSLDEGDDDDHEKYLMTIGE